MQWDAREAKWAGAFRRAEEYCAAHGDLLGVSSGCSAAAPGAVVFFGGMTKVSALLKVVEVGTPKVGANVGDMFSNTMN